MLRLVMRRVVAMPLLLLGVVTIAFVLSHFTQANPLSSLLSERQLLNPEVVAATKARWGLDKTPVEQYVIYVERAFGGDLGISFRSNRPVLRDIGDRLPATMELVIAAMIIGTIGGITLGVVAAATRDRWPDYAARAFSVFGCGLLLLYVFSVLLGWLPGPGRLASRAAPPPTVTGFFTIDALLAGDL